jgi:predicted enzyme related to lactoylglutathione lyase
MAQGNFHGRFLWQELLSADPATAVSFYGQVVGWHAHPNAFHPAYTEFGIGGDHYAGMAALTDATQPGGTHSYWLSYIGASDVDATVASAQQLGATVVQAAQTIEHIGRYATLKDPQGALFAVYTPSGTGQPRPPKPPLGSISWMELAASDYEAAIEFYGKLFGWQVETRMDMGAAGTYLIFGLDGAQLGGMYRKDGARSSDAYWLAYAEVASADAATATAAAAGGRVLSGPIDVPGGGRIAQLLDPSGAMIALHSAGAPVAMPSKPAAKPAAPKPATPKPATPKPAASKPTAPKPATPKPAAAKKPTPTPVAAEPVAATPVAATPAAKKKAGASKKVVAKKKTVAKKAAPKKKTAKKKTSKKSVARKSAAKSAGKSAKKSVRKSAKKAAAKSARKSAGKSSAGKKKTDKKKDKKKKDKKKEKKKDRKKKKDKRGGKARRKK